MAFLSTVKRVLRWSGTFVALTLTAGILGAALYAALLPQLAAWPLTSRITWPGTAAGGPTVIERTQQVVLSQEEGLERFATAPRTAVVRMVSIPTERLGRDVANRAVRMMSGLLVTNDGFVAVYMGEPPLLENRRFTVFFSDGSASQAQFIAYDSVVNVAYFRTERSDTPTIAFAHSDDVRQGRRFMVLAGTIDATEGRLATGYIGERARTFNLAGKTVALADKWEGVFLSDRPIDPTFVGGAAVAMDGELIGLVGTLSLDVAEKTFILPANALRQSLQRVIDSQVPTRTTIGAYYVSLSKETALTLGVTRDQGALIFTPSEQSGLAVISGSLAARAGLRYGDIVTAVNGTEITLDRPFSVAVYAVPIGEHITLSVERAGALIELPLVP